ncbi:MAG TPA: T9SS type A sorting domain-containing protein [Chryseolinea sp.]|nr:T9SS type A sorting domain-containing protein [Chryseolinea sp.]
MTYLLFSGPATVEGDVLTITEDEEVVVEVSVAGNDRFQPGRKLIVFGQMNILAAYELEESISVFPVPTRSSLFVRGPEDEQMVATVLDGHGKVVVTRRFKGMTEFEMAGYKEGLYLVRVERAGVALHCTRVLKF